MTIQEAKAKLEAKRGSAPAQQQPAIDFALLLMTRAIAHPMHPGSTELVADYVDRQTQSNEECASPYRETASAIIGKLLL